jgi:predicted permease
MGTVTAMIGSGAAAAQLISFRIFAMVAIIMIAGSLMARWEGGGQQTTLDRLNNQIFIPCLVFAALNRTPLALSEAVVMAGGAVLFSLCSYPLVRWWHGRIPDRDTGIFIPMLFSSTSTLLLPLSYLLFGSQGLAKATFFHLMSLFLMATWGMKCIGQPSRLTAFLKTPTLHVALLAMVLKQTVAFEFSQQIRELLWLVERGIGMMASGAIPILLISHGYALYTLRGAGGAWWSPAALVRMIVLPAAAVALICVLRVTGYASLEKGYDLLGYLDLRTSEAILLLASALPCTVSVFWRSTGWTPSGRTASLILSSTLISLIALTVLVYLINRHIFSA